MSDSQSGEGALELGTGIPVIGHGIMAKEAEAVGVDRHGQAVLEKEAPEVLEVVSVGTKTAPRSLREWSSTVSRRVCFSSAGHHWWMEESCCQSSLMRERSQRRRALGRGSGWQRRSGK